MRRVGITEQVVRPSGADWRGAVSLVTGFVAKEIIVSSMGVLYSVGYDEDEESEALRGTLREHFTPSCHLPSCCLCCFTLHALWRW